MMHIGHLDLILIRGAPGAGKTLLSNMLKQSFPEGITVETDHVRSMINSPKWADNTEYMNGLVLSSKVCSEYISYGYHPVIVVDSFGSPFLKDFLKQINSLNGKAHSINYRIITLYCDDRELKRRIQARKSGFNDINTAYLVNGDMMTHRHENEIFIDTSNMSPDEVWKNVIGKLIGKASC